MKIPSLREFCREINCRIWQEIVCRFVRKVVCKFVRKIDGMDMTAKICYNN